MEYVLIYPMLKKNEKLAAIILNVLILLIFIIFIILMIVSLVEKSKIKCYNAIKSIMRIILPTVSLTFFGQIFESLILIYLCDKSGTSEEYNAFTCPDRSIYYLYCFLCLISILFLLMISFITISLYYKPNFIKDKNNSLNKIDTFPNKVFFVNKIIFIILTSINSKSQIFIWFTLIILFISTYANMIGFTKYNNYVNRILLKINKFFSILLFFFMLFLIIGKIFSAWGFNGTIYIYLFCIIISILSAFLFKDRLNAFSYINFKELNTSCERIIYINTFIELVKTKYRCREKTLTFDSFIFKREENCINPNCKLKKYLISVRKGQPNDFILFQYCQELYEIAIKKFPDDYILKVNYIVYLIVQMSKRKLAEKVLYTMKFKPFYFEQNYIVFYCKNFVKSHNILSEFVFKEENKNVMRKMEYDKLYEEFKNDIIQASSLYYDFWNSLNKYHLQGIDNFGEIKNIGKELKLLINGVEEKFKILHNVKGDDANLLYLYSGFTKYILEDKTKYDDLKNISSTISNVDKIKDFEIDYTNYDLRFFEESDEYKFIVVSAEEEKIGKIINISPNASKVFGFLRSELIGKNITYLLPGITQYEFGAYLKKHTNQLKIKFYDALTNKKEYIPQFDELFIGAKDKSKYLMPLYIKMVFVQTEESNHAYIMTISYLEDVILNKMNDIFKLGSIFNPNRHKEEKLYKYCMILTDMNFIIQTFTSNCQEHLGLDTHYMNSNIDITLFISEFNEAVFNIIAEERKKINDKSEKNDYNLIAIEDSQKNSNRSKRRSNTGLGKFEDISPEKKLIYKRLIAEKNYSESKLVTWKSDVLEYYMRKNKKGNIEGSIIITQEDKNSILALNNEEGNEKIFLLIIKKVEFNNKQVGFYFFFRREQVNCLENDDNKIKSSFNDTSPKSNKINKKKLKNHKTLFTSFKSSDNLILKNDKESNNSKKTKEKSDVKKEIKYSKSQKKITKMPKSLDFEKIQVKIPKNDNIVGLIESRIKNILNDDILKKDSMKVSSFKKMSSHLSLGSKEKKEEEIPEILSGKKIIETSLKIQNYVPKCNFNFSLDVNRLSFKPNYTLCKTNEFNNLLKSEAEKKLNIDKTQKNKKRKKDEDSSFNYSSNEENESLENEEYSSSKTFSDSKKNAQKKVTEKNKKENNKVDLNKEYYRVSGLNKIKYMIFDFEQEMVIEKEGQYDNKSEVENIITNYKLKLPTVMDKDGNDPSIKVNKFLLKYSNKDLTKDKIIQMNSVPQNQNTQKIKKQKESCKKLETELNKREKETSVFLHLLNFIIFAFGGFSLYFTLIKLNSFKNHLRLLIYALLVRYYTNLGVYHTRMFTLSKLNFFGFTYVNYANSNRTNYMEKLYTDLENDFSLGSQFLEQMIAIDIKLSEHNEEKLYNEPYVNTMMGKNFAIKNVTSSLIAGIAQIYSHFYYLVANIKSLDYNSPEILNFILNVLNNAGIGVNEIINIFTDEISHKKENHIKLTIIILVIYFILLIIIFFTVRFNYLRLTFKRDSYISIFYQINLSYIRTSIMKCEKFLNQLNPNELITNKEKKKEGMDNTVSFSNFDDNLLSNEQTRKSINNETNQSKIRKGDIKVERNITLLLVFIGFLLMIFLYMLIPLIEFSNYVSTFETMALYMLHMLHYHNNILNIYNAFNEYLFYNQSTIDNTPILEFLDKTINITYNTLAEDLNYVGTYSETIPGLYEIYSKVQKEQFCSETNLCEPYIETTTSLGYYSFVAFMITEIKVKVNYIKILDQTYASFLWGDSTEIRSMILFTFIQQDVDVMFNLVILHYIEEEVTLTVNKIFESINKRDNTYIAIYVTFIAIILLLYLFFWYPLTIEVQEQIFKTKEALNIIPVEILESQTNIKGLLGISDLNE